MNRNKPTLEPDQALAGHVRSSGGRNTPERAAVARLAASRPGLWTAAELCGAPELQTFKVSRSTVYSTVSLMVEHGLLACHHVGSGPALYEARGSQPGALLMFCSRCGAVKKATLPEPVAAAIMQAAKAWAPECFDIVARGLCPSCRRRASRARRAEKQEK